MPDSPTAPRFRLELPGLRHRLTVVNLYGTEALSQPYLFTLDVLSHDPDITPAQLMYQPAFLVLDGDGQQGIHGQVQAVARSHYRSGPVCLRLSLGPRLACLAQRQTARVFQGMSATQIIARVLGEHGLHAGSYRFELQAECAVRGFCVQYRENDLQFVQRLCAEEGIHYHFVHSPQAHQLMFVSGLGGTRRTAQAPWSPFAGQAGVTRFTVCHTGSGQEHSRNRRRAEGRSNLPFVSCGHLLPLNGHPRAEWNHLWRVTHVEHRGEQGYINRFVAQPWDVPANVPAIAAPRLPALQRAWLVGPGGQPAERDPGGRVRVQFEWSLQGHGARFADCWLAVQPGLRMVLQGGMAVLVALGAEAGGEPEVIGCLDTDALYQDDRPQDVQGVQVQLDAGWLLGERQSLSLQDGPALTLQAGSELCIQVGDSRLTLNAQGLLLDSPDVTFSASGIEPAIVAAQAPGDAPQGQATDQGEEQEDQP